MEKSVSNEAGRVSDECAAGTKSDVCAGVVHLNADVAESDVKRHDDQPTTGRDGSTWCRSGQNDVPQHVEDNVTHVKGVNGTGDCKRTECNEESYFAHGSPINSDNQRKPASFANVFNTGCMQTKVNCRSFINEEKVENIDTVLPWIQKLMKNEEGVFLFKFSTKTGMEQVLERGPWMIRKNSLILNKWTPSFPLKKDEVTKPLMLNAFTSSMCVESWGCISFARGLVEISSDMDLKTEFDIDDDGVTNCVESGVDEDVVCNPNTNENKHYGAESCKGHAHHGSPCKASTKTYANLFNTESKQVNNELRSNTGGVSDSSDVKSDGEINVIKRVDFRSLVNVEKNLAFTIVQNYVKNTWAQFGLQNLMKNDDGVFLFKFDSKEGLEKVLERGPWIIRNTPLILNRWTLNVSLKRDEVTKVPVWVKLHNVPVVAYSADGLSLIATQIGKPIMLDAFTSSMCEDSWGRINFTHALVEINVDSDLKHEVSMAIPLDDGTGHTREVIKVEYEWKPPHCNDCKIFGHTNDKCPNRVILENPSDVSIKNASTPSIINDGFTKIKRKENNSNNKKGADADATTTGPSTSNSFDVLNNIDEGAVSEESSSRDIQEDDPETGPNTSQINEDLKLDDEVDEFIYHEGDKFGDKFDIRLKDPEPSVSSKEEQCDGFTEVKRKKNKGRKTEQQPMHTGGVRFNEPKPSSYRPKQASQSAQGKSDSLKPNLNPFDALNILSEEDNSGSLKPTSSQKTNHGVGNGVEDPNTKVSSSVKKKNLVFSP
ncbi:ribonuclease H-like domain-containing protein [Tanacetum coccineum]